MYYNVLPEESKKELRREYLMRSLVVAFFGLTVVGIIATVSLLPSYIATAVKEKNIEAERDAEKLRAVQSGEELSPIFSSVREKISILEEKNNALNTSGLISKILEIKPSGISVGNIVYEAGGAARTLVFSGVAATRGSLTAFRDRIEKTPPFEKVSLPVEVFAKNTDVEFSLTIKGSF